MTRNHPQKSGSAAHDVHDIRALTAVTPAQLQPRASGGRRPKATAEPTPPNGGR